jgi:predicted phosphodiesterase
MSESVKLGKVSMTLEGDYSSSQAYEKLTCVQYDGRSWVSRKQVPAGVVPTEANSAYWQKISDRGVQGPQGQSYVDKELVPIVNDLTTGGSSNVLSAEQGKVLDGKLATLSEETSGVKLNFGINDFPYKNQGFFKGEAGIRIIADDRYMLSDYISANSGDEIIYQGATSSSMVMMGVVFADENRNYLSEISLAFGNLKSNEANKITIPDGVSFVRFSASQAGDFVGVYKYSRFDKVAEDIKSENVEIIEIIEGLHSEIKDVEKKTEIISTGKTNDSKSEIVIESNTGEKVVTIDDDGVKVTHLKVGEVDVEKLASKDSATAKRVVNTDDIEIQSEDGETIVKVVNDGLIVKSLKLRKGDDVFDPFGTSANYEDAISNLVEKINGVDSDFRMLVTTDPHNFELERHQLVNAFVKEKYIDAMICLGDINVYSSTLDKKGVMDGVRSSINAMGTEKNCFYAIGNHDVNVDAWYEKAKSGLECDDISFDNHLTKREKFRLYCSHLQGEVTFNEKDYYGCYYYKDFDAAKIRLIVLDTSDVCESVGDALPQYLYSEDMSMTQTQIDWLEDVALNLMDKGEDRTNWNVLVCAHHYTSSPIIRKVLSAFKQGADLSSRPVSEELSRKEYSAAERKFVAASSKRRLQADGDFSEQGAINVIGLFCGHLHLDSSKVYPEGMNPSTSSAYNILGFITNNSRLYEAYDAEVSGLSEGKKRIEVWGSSFVFETESLPTAKRIQINGYFKNSDHTEMTIFDANNYIIKQEIIYKADSDININDYSLVSSVFDCADNDVNKQKFCIVCIDKQGRNIKGFTFGNTANRDINY